MNLRKRPEVPSKVKVEKEKTAKEPKAKKEITPRKKRTHRRNSRTKKKPAVVEEVIEIPPVEQYSLKDLMLGLEGASKEEQELKDECSLIFECNKCHGYFRSLGSYIEHNVSYCGQFTANILNQNSMQQIGEAWPLFSETLKQTLHEELRPVTRECKAITSRSNS